MNLIVYPEKMYGDLKDVVGIPYSYLKSADPNGRVFMKHMMQNAPLIMIRPGRVKFSEDTTDFIVSALNSFGRGVSKDTVEDTMLGGIGGTRTSGGVLFNHDYDASGIEKKALDAAIAAKQRGTVQDFVNNGDASARYFEFNSSIATLKEYQSVMRTLTSRVFSRLEDKSVMWADVNSTYGPVSTTNGGFYTFWSDNSSSVSETASAEVGPTKMAGLVKGVSEISKEAQFFLGENFRADGGQHSGPINDAIQGIADFVGGDVRNGGFRGSLGDAILGMNPMFPEIWKDSSFNRDYNLSFKFHSPYGTPVAIYQNVIQPFLMLLSLVLPVQTNPGVYSEPFVFQIDCPGRFACDLGICTNFTFVKGGSENLWTSDGLPRQIDVTMSVRDLYPHMVASRNNESLFFNIAMGSFLDNLAGVSMFRGEEGKGDVMTRLRSGVNNALQQVHTVPNNIETFSQKVLEQTGVSSVWRMFTTKDRG